MTLLRQRMTEDMQLRGLAPATQRAYLRYVEQLTLFTGKSPNLATDYVSHEQGTHLMIRYVDQFWCPTIHSSDLTLALHDG